MRNLFSSPLGANIAPIGIKKDVAVGVIPAILGAASIAGGIANTLSQADANKTNKQISDDQLAFAKEQYEREKEENRYLIQSQREYDRQVAQYNSPVEERKRLEAAGINPALAKYGQSGLMQASQVGVGSPAQFKMPESYKAQPLNFDAVANGLNYAANSYYQEKANERADYELASNITFRKLDAQNKFMETAIKAKEAGINEKWINDQIARAWKDSERADKQFEHQKSVDDARKAIDDRLASVEEAKVLIQNKLAESQISLNQATISELAQMVAESKERVVEMRKNGISEREVQWYVAQQEKKASELLEYEIKQNRYNYHGFRGKVTKALNFMFSPLKGIFSANAAVKTPK